MLLPQIKEREYRFKLALRMGLPVFGLALTLIINRLISNYENLDPSFFVIAILLIVFNIYFIFYIIYNSFDIKITEVVSKTFTREYLYRELKKNIDRGEKYSLILVSIDNLIDINKRYGIKNTDRVIQEVTLWIEKYFETKNISNFPMGRIKDGDFVIGLNGSKESYIAIMELMCIRSEELKVDDIEIKISSTIVDTTYSKELDYLIENLFEIQIDKRSQKLLSQELDPNEIELFVMNAIKNRSFTIMSQKIFNAKESNIEECFVKLITPSGKIIHQKIYMKVLDRLGLMVDFDLIILEKNIINYLNSKNKFAMSISPSSLRNHIFIHRAKGLLANNIEIKDRVIFLLSENSYYSHVDRYNSILRSFKDLGVTFCIDRLGSIHTSFLYLRELDIDMVRFDSFYSKNILDDNYRGIVEGFNLMAHKKGVKTWIRLIETGEIKEKVDSLEIDYMQGNFLSPINKKEVR